MLRPKRVLTPELQRKHDALAAAIREVASAAGKAEQAETYARSAALGYYQYEQGMRPAFLEVSIGITEAHFEAIWQMIYQPNPER